jgi:surface polysaccharide O-acyltransferase-like enzyme
MRTVVAVTQEHPSGALERVQYLDVVRVLSMLAVVFLHSAARSLRAGYGSSVWHFVNVLTSLMSAAVPLFFMLSGALLLSSPHTLSVGYTLRKRVPRLLVPFLVWSVLAVAYYFAIEWRATGTPDWAGAIDKLKHLPSQPTAIALWFMYALIPLYILSPLIKRLVDSLSREAAIYLMALWVFFSCILPTVASFAPQSLRPIFTLDSRYDLSVMAGYAGYFVAGYYLMRLRRPVPKKWLAAVIGVDLVAISLGTWGKTAQLGAYSELFKTYTHLFTVVMSCALFLLCKELARDRALGKVAATAVGMLTPIAFGVYLVHNLLVDLFSRLTDWSPAGSIPLMVAYYLVVLVASVALIAALAAIRPLCWVLTGQRYAGWWPFRARRPAADLPEGGAAARE